MKTIKLLLFYSEQAEEEPKQLMTLDEFKVQQNVVNMGMGAIGCARLC